MQWHKSKCNIRLISFIVTARWPWLRGITTRSPIGHRLTLSSVCMTESRSIAISSDGHNTHNAHNNNKHAAEIFYHTRILTSSHGATGKRGRDGMICQAHATIFWGLFPQDRSTRQIHFPLFKCFKHISWIFNRIIKVGQQRYHYPLTGRLFCF